LRVAGEGWNSPRGANRDHEHRCNCGESLFRQHQHGKIQNVSAFECDVGRPSRSNFLDIAAHELILLDSDIAATMMVAKTGMNPR
jgi:hypothetical protein